MTMHNKICDVGWMYHNLPVPKKTKDPVFMPPISQIPNIGCSPEDLNPPKFEPKSIFKSTDSAIIRLAKAGGRSDLLCFQENTPYKGPPIPYNRCDWYYLQDNALEDSQKDGESGEKHVFKVPFYMTQSQCNHEKPLPKSIVETTPPALPPPRIERRCPKATVHRPGYADYNKKVNKIVIKAKPDVHDSPIRFPKKDAQQCDPTTLQRLLAHDYSASDYEIYRRQWQEVNNYYKDKPVCRIPKDKLRKKPRGPTGNDLTV